MTIAIPVRSPYDPEVLSRLREYSAQLRGLPGVRRVDSLETYPLLAKRSDGEFAFVVSGTTGTGGLATDDWQALISNDPVSKGLFVSKDGLAFALNVTLDGDIDGPRRRLVSEVERIVASSGDLVSGVPVFRTKVNERTAYELGIFVPGTLVMLGALLFLAFSSLTAVVANLVCGFSGAVAALGAMGFLGIPVSLSTMTLPPILLALGSAYSSHVLGAYKTRKGLTSSRRGVAAMVALSGLTTALGFLAMTLVPVDAIQELGTIGAIGTFFVTAASLSLCPIVLSAHGLGRRGAFAAIGRWGGQLAAQAVCNPRLVVLCWLVIGSVMGAGVLSVQIDTDIIRWFAADDPIRRDHDKIRNLLAGITPMNVVLESADESLLSPDALAAVDSLTRSLDAREDIGRAISIADLLRQAGAVFAGETDLPGSPAVAEQYLSLLSGIGLTTSLITEDRLKVNIPLRVNVNGSKALLQISDDVSEWWAKNGVVGVTATTTGIMYEFGRAQVAIAEGQIRGLSFAFLGVAFSLVLVLGTIRSAALAVVPNVIPLLMAYGAMGWFGLTLDAATACIGAVALGIAVDDTVHVAAWYGNVRKQGASVETAAIKAVRHAAPALILSTAIVSLGFGVLAASSFEMVSNFGLITSSIIVLCLVADLTLLPALLALGDGESEAV